MKITVWLEEEYGYRHWRWETGMTDEELMAWWRNLKTVRPYFFSPQGLPGKLEEQANSAHDKLSAWKAHIHEDEDSYLVTPTGEHIYHRGYRKYEC